MPHDLVIPPITVYCVTIAQSIHATLFTIYSKAYWITIIWLMDCYNLGVIWCVFVSACRL